MCPLRIMKERKKEKSSLCFFHRKPSEWWKTILASQKLLQSDCELTNEVI